MRGLFCSSASWGKYQLGLLPSVQFSHSVVSDSFAVATPWITACQASLSITNSRSSLKLTSIKSVMPSSHLILYRPLLLLPQSLPASESFPMCQPFAWGGQSTGVSALASFLAKNTQGWFPLEWTGWISLQSKGLLRVFSNTTVQKNQFFGAQLSSQSNSYIHTWPLEKPQPCFLKLASLKQPNHSLLSPHLAGSVRDLGKSISRRGSPLVLNLLEREVLRGLTSILPISLHQTVLPYPAAYPDNFRSFSVSFPSI